MEYLFQSSGFYFLAELFFKSTVILAITLALVGIFRKQPAAFRHFLLSVALMGILFIPVLTMLAPGWHSPVIPSWMGKITEKQHPPLTEYKDNIEGTSTGQIDYRIIVENKKQRAASTAFKPVESNWPLYLWIGMAVLILARVFLGLYGTDRLTRQAVGINPYPWQILFTMFKNKNSLKNNVHLRKHNRVIVPLTCGIRDAVIIMPPQSENWSMEQCSSALFHELSHVKRRDFLVRLLARVSCSIYWFNPLCWLAFRKLKREQEKACDEMVLKIGIKPSTYASHLLQMKLNIEKERYMPAAALAMADRTEFKDRLVSILKKQLNIKEVPMKTKMCLAIIGIFFIALIATAKPVTPSNLPDEEKKIETQTTTATTTVEVQTDKDKKKETGKKEVEKKEIEVYVTVDDDETAEKEGKDEKGTCEKDKKNKCVIKIISKDKKDKEGSHKTCKVIVLPKDCQSGDKHVEFDGENIIISENGKIVKKIKIDPKTADSKDKKIVVKTIVDKEAKKGDPEKEFNVEVISGDEDEELDEIKHEHGTAYVVDKDGKPNVRVFTVKTTGGKETIVMSTDPDEHLEKEDSQCKFLMKGDCNKIKLMFKGEKGKETIEAVEKAASELKTQVPAEYSVKVDKKDDSIEISMDWTIDKPGDELKAKVEKALQVFNENLNKILASGKDEGKKVELKKIYIKSSDKKESEI